MRLEILGDPAGLFWERRSGGSGTSSKSNASSVTEFKSLRDYFADLAERVERDRHTDIPVFAFYDTDRAVFDIPERKKA